MTRFFSGKVGRRALGAAMPFALATAISAPAAAQISERAPAPPQDNVTACQVPRPPVPIGVRKGAANLHVEVKGDYGPYEGTQFVMVSNMQGMPLLTLDCDGAWANFRVDPGKYEVAAFSGTQASDPVIVNVPRTGARVTLTLKDTPNPLAGGPPPVG